jgi:hypothetical protein
MSAITRLTEEVPVANLVVRGRIFSDHLTEYGGRGGALRFAAPDASKYLEQLPLGDPGRLADLYRLSFDDILDYLEALGARLDIETNPHLQRARALSYLTAPTTPPIVDRSYSGLRALFAREAVREVADKQVGIAYLEGWVEDEMRNGLKVAVRCFGARALHIVAGNSPMISAMTIIRNAILRSDAIIKAPSNDPFTALAIAETMCEMDPDHPITKHLSVAYWRGGDTAFEEKLYQPHNIEKIVAWGGLASVKHVTQYIQPGLELISLDPKRSVSLIGPEAFESEETLSEAAVRLAADFGGLNQVGCVNARVVYVLSGTDVAGLDRLTRLGKRAYEALPGLPSSFSTTPKTYDRDLKAHVDALRLDESWYTVFGGEGEGAVIVSRISEPVEFAAKLADRTVNLVPVDTLAEALAAFNAYTQTVGVYPETLKDELLDVIPLYGAQRLVSLGYATSGSTATPQDGIEPLRRMGKWIVNEVSSPDKVAPPWTA